MAQGYLADALPRFQLCLNGRWSTSPGADDDDPPSDEEAEEEADPPQYQAEVNIA